MCKKITLVLFFIANVKAFAIIYYVDASKADNSGAGTSWQQLKKTFKTQLI